MMCFVGPGLDDKLAVRDVKNRGFRLAVSFAPPSRRLSFARPRGLSGMVQPRASGVRTSGLRQVNELLAHADCEHQEVEDHAEGGVPTMTNVDSLITKRKPVF
jgi:hypothetical protein